jgi:chorismate dehydratase
MTEPQARIGMVNFINTAPLYEVWKRTVHNPLWQIVEAAPAKLNKMLFADGLDMGLVSSQEYAAHPDQYMLLDDISISASGPVGSVFLFSICEPQALSDSLVVLSGQSQTSVSLVKIILEKFYQVFPRYQRGNALDAQQDHKEAAGVLAIGDEALLLAQSGKYPYQLDLGEVWYEHTSLPFVYAVWAIREEFCKKKPGTVKSIQQELKRCVEQGRSELVEISRKFAPRVSMTSESCYGYLSGIEYDFGPRKKKSLERFIAYLIASEKTPAAALPLKVF